MKKLPQSLKYAKKNASGIVTPVRALDTGLVPDDWRVLSDDLEGEIDLSKLDFSSCPVREGERCIRETPMLERARQENAIGSLGFAKIVLDEQEQGRDIIPPELLGEVFILLPRTILWDRYFVGHVGYFNNYEKRWVLFFTTAGNVFDRHSRFVRPRE